MMAITANTTLTAQSLANYTDNYQWTGQPNCAPFGTFGPDRTYRVSIPVGQRVSVAVTPNGAWDPSIQVSSVCTVGATNTCVAGSNSAGSNVVETLVLANSGSTTLDTFLVVDTSSILASITPFDISFTFSATPVGEICALAEVLTLPASRAADALVSYSNDYLNGAGCPGGSSGSAGPERVYRTTVASNTRLTAVASASTNADGGVAFSPTVSIVPATTCAATLTCLAGATGVAGIATAVFDNGGASRDVFIVVDSATVIPGGTFALSVTSAAATLPVGDVCANATPAITTTTTLSNEDFTGYAGQYSAQGQSLCSYQSGLDRAYLVTIPAGQVLTASAFATDAGVLPDGGFINLSLSVVPSANECQSGPCVTGANATSTPGASEFVSRNNTGATSENVFVVVDSNLPAAAGTYSLAVTLAVPPIGDTCSDTLTAITATGNLTGQTLAGYSNDFGSGTSTLCRFASGADRVYRVTIPAMNRLTATTVTSVFADHGLSIVDGLAAACGSPTTCAASVDNDPPAGGETLVFDNSTGSPKTVFLIVDRFSGSDDFDLNVTIAPVVANVGETCQAPQVIAMSGTVSGQTTVGYVNNVGTVSSAACTGYSNSYSGRDRVYQISVGPGQTLTALVTPTTSFDPGVYFVASPASNCALTGTVCIGTGGDTNFTGTGATAAETGTFTNSTAAVQDVFIVVDSFSSTSSGGFDLTITLLP